MIAETGSTFEINDFIFTFYCPKSFYTYQGYKISFDDASLFNWKVSQIGNEWHLDIEINQTWLYLE